MKLATRLLASALLVLAVASPAQAFFLDEDTLEYKLYILDCLGLLGDSDHSEECGGPFPEQGPFDWVKGRTDPAPPEDCYGSLPPIYGARIHVATGGPCPG